MTSYEDPLLQALLDSVIASCRRSNLCVTASRRLLISTPFGLRARRRSSRVTKMLREGETACGADAGVTSFAMTGAPVSLRPQ